MKRITFSKNAWEDYLFWQAEDRKILKKINTLIKEIQSTLYSEIGRSEPLKYDLAGLWSRRIDHEHRLVYQVNENELLIYSCQYHYDL